MGTGWVPDVPRMYRMYRMGASWRHLGGVLGRLGGVLEASWGRLGGILDVLEASWKRLGGEDGEMARESQLKEQKWAFRSRVATSTLKIHRKTRGESEKIGGRLERNLNLRGEMMAIRILGLRRGGDIPP